MSKLVFKPSTCDADRLNDFKKTMICFDYENKLKLTVSLYLGCREQLLTLSAQDLILDKKTKSRENYIVSWDVREYQMQIDFLCLYTQVKKLLCAEIDGFDREIVFGTGATDEG